MSTDVLMPQLGETVAEGKILTWFKKVGDEVGEGDNLFEIETDKVTMEVQSISAGKLSEIRVKVGQVAKVGAVVATIGATVEENRQPQAAAASASQPSEVATAQTARPLARSPFEETTTPVESYGKASGPLGMRVSPLARRLIALNGLDIGAIARTVSTAGGSKIAERDVKAAMAAQKAQAAPPGSATPAAAEVENPKAMPITTPAPRAGEVIVLNTIRKRTGERLAKNWQTIPHVFQAIEIDFTGVDAVRLARKAAFKEETGLSLTFLPFISRATCLALKEFPQINAQLDEDTLTLSSEVNLGIAVDLSHNGLVVPVIRNANDLTLPGIAKAIGRQIDKARKGKLTAEDFAAGTYSISNNGAFGTSFTTPIINAPQVAILSTDAIRLRPAIVQTEAGAFVAPRLTGFVGQSFDHRAFDGAYSAAFLSRLKTILENRDWAAEFA